MRQKLQLFLFYFQGGSVVCYSSTVLPKFRREGYKEGHMDRWFAKVSKACQVQNVIFGIIRKTNVLEHVKKNISIVYTFPPPNHNRLAILICLHVFVYSVYWARVIWLIANTIRQEAGS